MLTWARKGELWTAEIPLGYFIGEPKHNGWRLEFFLRDSTLPAIYLGLHGSISSAQVNAERLSDLLKDKPS